MPYICMDRGTDKCPCILMEAGQCYTCGMIREGKCDCPAGWQGVCPYTEYMQRGGRPVGFKEPRRFTVSERRDFSSSLTVVTLKVPFAYAIKCREKGAFVMVDSEGFGVPVSVMESVAGERESREGREGRIRLAINASGPKTERLLKRCSSGSQWNVKGPYYTGLLRKESYNPKALSIVIAKGIALMPLLNIKGEIGGNLASFYLDNSKLPEEFEREYLSDMEYERVNLLKDMEAVSSAARKDYEYCVSGTGIKPNVLLMVSPYFAEKLKNLLGIPASEIISPNHSNMCCGEGMCGACSHSDEEGTTVRGCKCFDLL